MRPNFRAFADKGSGEARKRVDMAGVLITGAGGMIGSHLLERIGFAGGTEVIGTYFLPTVPLAQLAERFTLEELDVRSRTAMNAAIDRCRPDCIYHLAAQSVPVASWSDPWRTIDTNVIGTVNLFEAIRAVRKTQEPGYDPVVVVACSSAQYGASLTLENLPITERAEQLPLHPYGVSKVAQDLLALQYWRNDRIRSVRARIFNTTGPRKRDDVVSDFARRIALTKTIGGPLRVGNLETRRAILDVRDMIDALILLAERGEPGEAYNICGDRAWRIGDLIPIFEQLEDRTFALFHDPALYRPSDEPVILGSTKKLMERTGWRPKVGIEATLKAVLDYELAHSVPGEER